MISVHFGQEKVELREVRRPKRPRGYALIRMELAGICSTDIQLLKGYYGFEGIPGHEFTGTVVEADNDRLVGRRVVGDINLACGNCSFCARGMRNHCPKRKVLGIVNHPGTFQEYFTLPEENLHLVPHGISPAEAVFSEPLAAARRILDQIRIPPTDTIAVLGDGKLGLLIAQVLKAEGLNVTLFGRNPNKLALARGWSIRAKRRQSGEFDCVVEVTGSPEGFAAAVRLTRPRGNLILKSTMHAGVEVETAPIVVKELNITGSRCGDPSKALRLLKRGVIRTEPMITATYALAEAPKAIEHAQEKGVLKVLLSNQM
jgi:alcohol dehydrogenase